MTIYWYLLTSINLDNDLTVELPPLNVGNSFWERRLRSKKTKVEFSCL